MSDGDLWDGLGGGATGRSSVMLNFHYDTKLQVE